MPRRVVPHLAFALALIALAAIPLGAGAETPVPPDLVFAGPAESGGEVQIVLTADRTGVLSVALLDVAFELPGCNPLSGSEAVYFDPPEPVTGGAFDVQTGNYGTVHNPVGFSVDGVLESETTITGEVVFGAGLGCQPSPPVAFQANVVEQPSTEPALTYRGSAGGGEVILTVGPLSGLSSLDLSGVAFGDCTPADNPLDVRARFDPALSGLETSFVVSQVPSEPGTLSLTAEIAGEAITGTIELFVFPTCFESLPFTAALVTEAAPTPSPPPATPVAAQLPETGTGGFSHALGPRVTPLVALLPVMACVPLLLVALRRRA